MPKLVPYITSINAREQAEFYARALGGQVLGVMSYGDLPDAPPELKEKVLHLHMTLPGFDLYMTDATDENLQAGNAVSLSLVYASEDEARRAFDVLAEGGKVKQPFEPAFWGAHYGELEDRYGIFWRITQDAQA